MKKIKTSIEIEEGLHTDFKTKCAAEKKTMKDIILESIQKYVGKSEGFSDKTSKI